MTAQALQQSQPPVAGARVAGARDGWSHRHRCDMTAKRLRQSQVPEAGALEAGARDGWSHGHRCDMVAKRLRQPHMAIPHLEAPPSSERLPQ